MNKREQAPQIDDPEERLPLENAPCVSCAHLTGIRKCKAFEKIPVMIYSGKHTHITPYPGDNGIQYKDGRTA